ncbi:MAG TPA: hypothetical protein ENK28_04620 [Aliiroseovarius sp.]|nr:hypothetical protein [Aliiroseovarius sp.]
MGNNYQDWRAWLRGFMVWEWITHNLVLLMVLFLTATSFDESEITAIAIMALSTAITGGLGYYQFTRCMAHPRRYFRRVRWWMKRLIVFEYVGYMAELAVVLWLTATNFDQTELLTIAVSAAANGLMSWRGWRLFIATISEPKMASATLQKRC